MVASCVLIILPVTPLTWRHTPLEFWTSVDAEGNELVTIALLIPTRLLRLVNRFVPLNIAIVGRHRGLGGLEEAAR